jgi:hypothetical protein
MKVRDGQVGNRPAYVAMGIDLDGQNPGDVVTTGQWVREIPIAVDGPPAVRQTVTCTLVLTSGGISFFRGSATAPTKVAVPGSDIVWMHSAR